MRSEWSDSIGICRWDGLSGPNVILEQTYSRDHWKAHWLWLVKFFKHKNYILVDGKPMLILYRVWEVPNLQDLLQLWRKLAVDAGRFPVPLAPVRLHAYTISDKALHSEQSVLGPSCSQ